jgi:hypothetical protein
LTASTAVVDAALPMQSSLDAVLPLALRDLERSRLLIESLARNLDGLGCLWVVCPDADVARIREALADESLPFEIRVEPERRIVPEFALNIRMSGWFKQQLIKLACFEHVTEGLYLTFDADVVCTRRVTAAQLIGDGRGVCVSYPDETFRYWYERIEQVMRIRIPAGQGCHNVTPALLHTGGMSALKVTIDEKLARGEYSRGLRGLKQRWWLHQTRHSTSYAPWRVFLAAARPWTEYALYYSVLEHNGLFDRYHVRRDCGIYDNERSLWHAEHQQIPTDWDPSPAFIGPGPPWFLVAQSNTGIGAEDYRQRLAPLLRAD